MAIEQTMSDLSLVPEADNQNDHESKFSQFSYGGPPDV